MAIENYLRQRYAGVRAIRGPAEGTRADIGPALGSTSEGRGEAGEVSTKEGALHAASGERGAKAMPLATGNVGADENMGARPTEKNQQTG